MKRRDEIRGALKLRAWRGTTFRKRRIEESIYFVVYILET